MYIKIKSKKIKVCGTIVEGLEFWGEKEILALLILLFHLEAVSPSSKRNCGGGGLAVEGTL